MSFCGSAASWVRMIKTHQQKLARLQPTPSDYYGWRLWAAPGIPIDPTDLFRVLTADDIASVDTERAPTRVGLYSTVENDPKTVSLRWGRQQGFARRVSRAVASMPLCLLRSSPTTADGYNGQGLATAMGILGRNKGLQPWKLVFKATSSITSEMESLSTWAPRPAKVLRSFYKHTLDTQYHGLGEDYVSAAVELALLMADMPSRAVVEWLVHGLEHQSLDINTFLSDTALAGASPDVRTATLSAHYESSYVSMIISLNAMKIPPASPSRLDLICTRLLMRARGLPDPLWWQRRDVQELRMREEAALSELFDWKSSAARLLGLGAWPGEFDSPPAYVEGEKV